MGERDKPHSYRHEPSAPRETTPLHHGDGGDVVGGDGDDLAVDVDDEHAGGGGGALRRWIPAAFPPSDLLRRQPSASLFLVLCFSAASFWKTSGDPLYSRF